MAHTSVNTRAFVEAEQYSQFILRNLEDGLLPNTFFRDVSDFGAGDTLNIKSVGAATIQEVAENVPLTYNPIDTGTISLAITDFIGDGWYITDVLREDGNQVEALHAARGQESTRAVQENFETRFLQVAGAGSSEGGSQTVDTANTVNGFSHRFTGTGANNTMTLGDLNAMALSFDKANVPFAGRIAIVDPVVASTLNSLVTTSTTTQNNPKFQSVLEQGFVQNHNFVMNIFGWDIWTSNRLHVTTVEEAALLSGDGTAAPANTLGNVCNVFMSILDDNTRPIMNAWRRMPKTEGQRNVPLKRDEFDVTSRWGMGAQRLDTLGVCLTSATATS
jgi:hypothetical protein